jgi:tetratricopeptide (TPR) repeat protein
MTKISRTARTTSQRIALLLSATLLAALGAGTAASQQAPATKSAPDDAIEAHLGKGYDALREDRYQEAGNEFQAALALDPTLVEKARFPLAVALFEQHKSGDSRSQFEAVRKAVGDHPNVLYYLGRLDLEDRNFEAAIHDLSKAVAQPPFPDTSYYLGFAYFKQGELPPAEKWLKEAARLNPNDARVPYQLGLVYRKEGREEEAKKALALSQEVRRSGDNETRLRSECAEKLAQGPREEARAICDQLYDPDDAQRLTALGAIYGQHGDLQEALKAFRRAAELAPQSPQMQYNLALTYSQLSRFEEARAPLADAIKRWPDLFPLNALYGEVLFKLGQEGPAYEALRHAHQLNAQDAATTDMLFLTMLGLARKSLSAKQYREALRYLEEGQQLKPQEPAPHRIRGEIYTATGRPEKAASEQQEAERLTKALEN